MGFINILNNSLEELGLVKHPFYKMWNDGALHRGIIGEYAREYYHHVAAFPRYISQIHALCGDIFSRQILLENLIEEEQGANNHPELWLRFMEGINGTRDHAKTPKLDSTKKLVDGFFELTQKDYPTGLGALYAYERQTPEVSHSKIEGLKKHYSIADARTLEFFAVHEQADVWHTEELVGLISKLNEEEQKKAYFGALEGAKLLWQFLDGMDVKLCM